MLLAAGMLASVGCSSISDWHPSKMFSMDSTWPFKDKDKPREGKPEKMVCIWTDTVMTQAGQKPQRGFGGRILFYEKDEKKPILVDGQLIVYAFDEAGRTPTDSKPTRRYVFPAEQIPLHLSKAENSELGASYSFWLPWDEVGGPRTEVGLICRFEPKGGAVVTSEQAKQKLPGTEPAQVAEGPAKPPKVPAGVTSKAPVQTLQSLQQQRTEQINAKQANYEVPVNGAANDDMQPTKRFIPTTISLPSNFQMPSAESLIPQNLPSTGAGLKPYVGQPVLQQTPPAAAAMQQPVMPAGSSRAMLVSQTTPLTAGPASIAPMQPAGLRAGTMSNTAMPPANQQAAIQDLIQQQQALQQKLQQLQSSPQLNGAAQMAAQPGAGSQLSYPAAAAGSAR